jgi:hypothetical protein
MNSSSTQAIYLVRMDLVALSQVGDRRLLPAVAVAQVRERLPQGLRRRPEAARGIAEWIAFYNHRRPPGASGPPMAVWREAVVGSKAVDMMDNASALPIRPHPQQQTQPSLRDRKEPRPVRSPTNKSPQAVPLHASISPDPRRCRARLVMALGSTGHSHLICILTHWLPQSASATRTQAPHAETLGKFIEEARLPLVLRRDQRISVDQTMVDERAAHVEKSLSNSTSFVSPFPGRVDRSPGVGVHTQGIGTQTLANRVARRLLNNTVIYGRPPTL